MTSNSSSLSYYDWQTLWVSVAYIAQGTVIAGSNLFIVFVILRFKALRKAKEYLVILSLSLADGSNMLGVSVAGIRRTCLTLRNEHNTVMTSWACTTTSHNLIWSFSEILSGLALLIISVDRLLCVAFPLRYISWTTAYVKALFGMAYLYSIFTGTVLTLVLVYEAKDMNLSQTSICYGGALEYEGVNIYYATYRSFAPVAFAALSIIVYGFIWILYNWHQNRVGASQTTDNSKKQRLARQRRLTRNLGISCLCTIFVFMIPHSLGYILDGILPISVRLLFFIIGNFNPLCNVFIYYWRQPEIKKAIIALFTGKIMPDNLDQWKANSVAQQNKKGKQTKSSCCWKQHPWTTTLIILYIGGFLILSFSSKK